MKARMRKLDSSETPREFDLSVLEGWIGRDAACEIRVDSRSVSRKHVHFKVVAGGLEIQCADRLKSVQIDGVDSTHGKLNFGQVLKVGAVEIKLAEEEKIESVVESVVEVPVAEPEPAAANEAFVSEPAAPLEFDLAAAISTDEPEQTRAVDAVSSEDMAPVEMEMETPQEAAAASVDENSKTIFLSEPVKSQFILLRGTATPAKFNLEKDEIFIGRDPSCDVVIDDAKVSRRNSVIIRNNQQFLLRDLGSSNGTKVNGRAVREQGLSHDDRVEIGACEFKFIAVDQAFNQKAENFESVVEDELESVRGSEAEGHTPVPSLEPSGVFPSPGIAALSSPESPAPVKTIATKSLFRKGYDKYIRNFTSLKIHQKIMVLMAFSLFVYYFIYEEDAAPQKAGTAPKPTGAQKIAIDPNDPLGKLTPEQRKFVETQVQLAFDLYTQGEFEKGLFEVRKVFALVPDYSDAKVLERHLSEAKQARDAKEQEKKRKEEEEARQKKMLQLVQQARGLMLKKKYEDAEILFTEILTFDPDNAMVATWKHEIEDYYAEKKKKEQEKQVQEELKKRAWDKFNEGFALQKAEHFYEAIDVYREVPNIGTNDKTVAARALANIEVCFQLIKDKTMPLLEQAKKLESEEKWLDAYKAYETVLTADPKNTEAGPSMDRIRLRVDEKAKVIYAQAVIAESYDEYEEAVAKFTQILTFTPDASIYYERAKRKLDKILMYRAARTPASLEEKSGEPSGGEATEDAPSTDDPAPTGE